MNVLHFRMSVTRHSTLPFLWKGRCACGEYVLAPTEERATAGLNAHIESEEPFPIDMTPEENPDGQPK